MSGVKRITKLKKKIKRTGKNQNGCNHGILSWSSVMYYYVGGAGILRQILISGAQ